MSAAHVLKVIDLIANSVYAFDDALELLALSIEFLMKVFQTVVDEFGKLPSLSPMLRFIATPAIMATLSDCGGGGGGIQICLERTECTFEATLEFKRPRWSTQLRV